MERFNKLESLLTKEENGKYQNLVYPFNLRVITTALKRKLEQDPEYEVFIPATYYRHKDMIRLGCTLLVQPRKLFISNRGRILSTRGETPKILKQTISKAGYPSISLKFGPKSAVLSVHRILACSFIQMPDHLPNPHPNNLFVNHINGDKEDPHFSNLEWTTPSENSLHAYSIGIHAKTFGFDNHLTKPVKGVIKKGKYKGYQFILAGIADCDAHGFRNEVITSCCKGKGKTHRNCAFSYATEEEIKTLPRGLDEKMLKDIDSHDPHVKFEIIAINKNTGDEKLITGGKAELIELGFIPCCVSNVMAGRANSHKNHYFKQVPL